VLLLASTFPAGIGDGLTLVSVEPSTSYAEANTTFSINITVSNVYDLAGWEFKLHYQSAFLNGTSVLEGPFLKQGGKTFFYVVNFTDNYNATHGLVWATCALLGAVPGVNGSGTLATITFKAKQPGMSMLSLTDTLLSNSKANAIPHTSMNGKAYILIHDVSVKGVSPSKTVVGQGLALNVNVIIRNEGNYTETLNVTAYAGTITVETLTVTVVNGSSTTITFKWNTVGFAKGNYTISAYAWPVPGETDTVDNTFIDGWVIVAMPGDINADSMVDILDCVKVALAFGAKPSDPNWDPNADINNDNIIDIFDLFVIALHFGETDP